MAARITSEKGFYGWINLAVTALMGMVAPLYLVSFGSFLPFLVKEFGWTRGVASIAATINLFAMGICGPLAGIFIIRYGAKRAILLGNILGFLGFFMLFAHSRLWELYVGYGVLIGVASGLGGLLASTTILNNWFVRKRSLVLGIFLSFGGLGGIFLGPALMKLITTQGWRFAYLVISGMVLFIIILPAIFLKNKPQDLGQVPDGHSNVDAQSGTRPVARRTGYKTPVDFSTEEAMRTRCLWLLIAYFCMSMLAMNALMTHMISHLLDIGIAAGLAAVALSVMTGVMTFTQLGAGFIGMRYSMLSIAVSGEVLKIAGVFILIFTRSVPVIFLSMVILGMGFGAAMVATMNIFPNYFGLSNYPKIMGFTRLFWALVGGLGAPLAGYIRDTTGSYLPAFQMATMIFVLGLACLVFARPPVHPSLKETEPAEVYAGAS